MALFAYETLNIKVTSKVWMGVIKYTYLFTLIGTFVRLCSQG